MKKISFNSIRYGLVIVYFYTLIHKLADLSFLEESLRKSALLTNYAQLFKFMLPMMEIIVIILLVVNKIALKGLYFSLLLLFSFTFYLIALNNFSFIEGCSCGRIFNEIDYQTHVFLNISFILLNLISIILYDPKDLI